MSDTCKGCGKPIVWGVTENGTRVPLDPRPPVYRVAAAEELIVREHDSMVSHFATCPKASQFSRGKG